MQPAKEPPAPRAAAQETEVVAEQYDGVEPAELGADLLDPEQPRLADAALAHHGDRARRVVDRDHVLAPFLKVQRDAARARADVQDAAASEADRLSLVREPLPQRSEVRGGPELRRRDETVLALHDLDTATRRETGSQQLSEGVTGLHGSGGTMPGLAPFV